MFKKTVAFVISFLLISSLVGSVNASPIQTSVKKESSKTTKGMYLTTDPIKNRELIKSYGNRALNDEISYYINSSTYATSDYTLLNSYPTQDGDTYSNLYGVVRLYKANNTGKHTIFVLEQDSSISGVTISSSKYSGITKLGWVNYYESTGGSINLHDWSPKGTTEQTSTSSFNWSINPQIAGNGIGSLGGSFQLVKGRLVGTPSTAIYTETWTGDPVLTPANVAQQGATAWFVENGNGPGLTFHWYWNWGYSYWS
ncbi:hypothetical protein EJP82_08365 [Paenibacillus anaericanus]|uniref:Uncharacterized protein n=1 Tax=Paenibacillus anaericanus TaxID=170367 RepID=A0A433YBD6_9BACL|nr:hypothetical protein [Paenibacillus anaericanus]RUT47182.1 hypothetical protein EJP82_08365 [Paenibacillus anaericanus]